MAPCLRSDNAILSRQFRSFENVKPFRISPGRVLSELSHPVLNLDVCVLGLGMARENVYLYLMLCLCWHLHFMGTDQLLWVLSQALRVIFHGLRWLGTTSDGCNL